MAKNKEWPPEGFLERLENAWLKKGITKKELAKKIRRERKTVYAIFDGTSIPNALVLARLCKELNVSADYLLFGDFK